MTLPASGVDDHRPGHTSRWLAAVVVTTAILAVYNVVRSTLIPGDVHFGTNVTLAVVALTVGWAFGLTRADLGLSSEHARAGVQLGSAALGVVLVLSLLGGIVGVFVPAVQDALVSESDGMSAPQLLYRVLVAIPIGTVLVEELVFRGVLLGALLRTTTSVRALTWSAVLFGLWHVVPSARNATDDNDAAGSLEAVADIAVVGTALGTFVATAIAGAVFGWLRLRSRSTIAPMLAHLATNTIPLTVAWSVARWAT